MFRKLQRLMAVALLLGSPFLAWEQTGIPPVEFRNVVRGSGVDFVLHNCPTPDKRMIETMAGGVAVLDYDGDGRPDIFFTNGERWTSSSRPWKIRRQFGRTSARLLTIGLC